MDMVMKRVVSWLGAVVLGLAVAACADTGNSNDPNAQLDKEVQMIDDYLAGKGVSAIKDPTGIRMVIRELGKGFPAKVRANSTVSVDYIGRIFPNGVQFDQGTAKGPISGYIKGWQIALGLLPEGSRATLYIPSGWAYGPNGQNSIPGNATLEFDIAFNEIVRTSAELSRLGTDTVAVDTYLADKGIVAQKDTTGLRYVIVQQGGGAMPGLYDKLKYSIKYRLLTDDAKVVAESTSEPSEGYDSRAIDQPADGVKKALTLIPAGTKMTLYLPSILAFGPQGATADASGTLVIPANANVIVDIELTAINP
jgi:FKBP-type peptidyl-prolyl cis-trans isomerase